MIELLWYDYVVIISAGCLAGAINTLAGNGSAITLAVFTEYLGLPANLANGTNRIGVLAQGWAGTFSFYRNGVLKFEGARLTIVCTCLGALAGVVAAILISNEDFKVIYRFLMVAVLVVLLVRPKRWLHQGEDKGKQIHPAFESILYLILGFYGGFIQMGMGIFYLATVVLVSRYTLIHGNAIKTFVVALYTIAVLAVFHYRGLVHWQLGSIMAIGTMTGGYFTAEFASRYSRANEVAYVVLVIIVLAALASLFFRS